MAYKDPEKRRIKNREYNLSHREYKRTYYLAHREEKKASSKAYRDSHKEEGKLYQAERRRSNPAKYLWQKAKKRAKEKGLEFSLEVSDIHIPELCPVLNVPLFIAEYRGDPKKKNAGPNSPSLDRIDSDKGYIKGNVWVISWRANKIKADASLEELEAIVAALKVKLQK